MANVFNSAYRAVYKAFRAALVRTGVNVGTTAEYPRVELHSFVEGAPLDKDGSTRQISLTVESISAASLGEAVTMADDNATRLLGQAISLDGFRIVGVIPTERRDLTETSDTEPVLYHIIQTYNVLISK